VNITSIDCRGRRPRAHIWELDGGSAWRGSLSSSYSWCRESAMLVGFYLCPLGTCVCLSFGVGLRVSCCFWLFLQHMAKPTPSWPTHTSFSPAPRPSLEHSHYPCLGTPISPPLCLSTYHGMKTGLSRCILHVSFSTYSRLISWSLGRAYLSATPNWRRRALSSAFNYTRFYPRLLKPVQRQPFDRARLFLLSVSAPRQRMASTASTCTERSRPVPC